MSKNLLILAITLAAFGCNSGPSPYRPAQLASNYPSAANHPLSNRFVPIPAVLLEDLKSTDKRDDYRDHALTDADRSVLLQGLEVLPPALRRVLEDHVLGISFLDNFAGGGMTWDLYDAQGTGAGFWLIFNSQVLTATTSQWLTYRDDTAFETPPSVQLSEVAKPEIPAFQFLLTHEAAHVFDFAHGTTMTTREILAKKPVKAEASDFGSDRTYPLEPGWRFYDLVPGPKPAADTLPAAFDALAAHGYASFYGTQTAMEDWAELEAYGVLARDALARMEAP